LAVAAGPTTKGVWNPDADGWTIEAPRQKGATMRASEQITAEVATWHGVESGYGRRGEFAFKVRGREIGHLHGDHAAHFFFPEDVWATLYADHRIVHHPVFPDRAGPAARRIETADDVGDVIALMRLNYERSASAAGATATNPSAMQQKNDTTPIT
jgi:Family of unknown function (DUF5519)